MEIARTWLTGREAERLLGEVGVSRALARGALQSGLAGPSTRRGTATLYRAEDVRALARRRVLDRAALETHVHRHHGGGLLVLRGRVDESWELGGYLPALLGIYRELGWPLGVAATTGGFVTGAWDLLGTAPDAQAPRRRRLLVASCDGWTHELTGARLALGRGRPWHFLPGPWVRGRAGVSARRGPRPAGGTP